MNRRNFLKGMSLAALMALMPNSAIASTLIDLNQVNFDSNIYSQNDAQLILIYLYGGASELAGNLTNFAEINQNSQFKYDTRYITPTENNFWSEAGGEQMERMLNNGDLNIFRTCFRRDNPVRSHGICTSENQRGVLNVDDPSYEAGIVARLAKILYNQKAIDENTTLPFMTMEGESGFFKPGPINLEKFLYPAAINDNLTNPYERKLQYEMYTKEEWDSDPRPKETQLSKDMDALAKEINKDLTLQAAFEKRAKLDSFIETIKSQTIPDGINYPDTSFGKKLKNAVHILVNNSDTKVVSLGSGGLGGWDDHSSAESNYPKRMKELMSSIEVALNHLKAENKDNVSIMVFCEFGRNVNLNSAKGWDHGNNQNLYIFGGKKYFNQVGIVGETTLNIEQNNHRLFLEPKEGSYEFEPYSIAATIYKMFGVTNPEVLTKGYGAIDAGLFKS
ncbi:MAG TPA: DUF1501 domain-containing protein [Campylobacterales bacterium]|nr:DUF1501 domain-containing protein [Campylobacterales bacterium]